MIVVCPKAFAGTEASHEGGFLRYYLSKRGEKACLANEVWDAFRYRLNKKVPNANNIIANFRGVFHPENVRLAEDYQEKEPNDYKDEELIEKTKDLITRRWADIDIFITQEPTKYINEKIRIMTLEEFYVDCMNNDHTRDLIPEFCSDEAMNKYS